MDGWKATRLVAVDSNGAIAGGAQMLTKRLVAGRHIGYVPKGPVLAVEDPELMQLVLMSINDRAKQLRVVHLTIQPPNQGPDVAPHLVAEGFTATDSAVAPTATIFVDLSPDPETMLARMKKNHRRYIRYGLRQGMVGRQGDRRDLPVFHRLLEATASRQGFTPYSLDHFEEMWDILAPAGQMALFVVEFDGEPVSAQVVVGFGDTVITKNSGWSGEHSRFGPNHVLEWTTMMWAKEAGYVRYDLEGIDPVAAQRLVDGGELTPEMRRQPFYWKMGFGGEVAVFPPPYLAITSPLLRHLYRSIYPRVIGWPITRRAGRPDSHRMKRFMRPGGRTRGAPAVVVGLDSMQGLAAARTLARRGVAVIGVAHDPDNDACRTKVCGEIIITDTASEQLIERLEELGPSLPERAVLVPCEDASVRLIAANRQRLEPWFAIKLPPSETVELLMDKARFYPHAAATGLPVPQTFLIESRSELDAIAGDVAFPCILKPANSATSQWESNVTVSAFRVEDWETLSDLYDRHHHLSPVLLVQQWVEGPDSNLYSCNCYIDESGEVLVSFTAKKTRQWPPHIGKSCLGEECEAPPVLEESLRLLGGVDYVGLGYVELKQDAVTGEFFIIEPNVGRPTGRSAIAEAGGVELLYTMYCDAAGLPLPARRVQTFSGAKWIHLRHDFQSALYYWRRGELTLGEWWRSRRGRKAYALFSLRDPLPFFSDLLRVAKVAISPRRRRKWLKSGFG